MKKVIISTLILGVLLFGFSQATNAIGIVNKLLEINNAIRGEVFEDELKIFNSENEEVKFELTSEGDIAEWITYYLPEDSENEITEILADPKSYTEAMVHITIPEDAANGEYNGKLTATLRPIEEEDDSEGSRTSVVQRLSRSVKVVVTDNENIILDVSIIPETYDVKDNQSLDVRLIHDNQGNIRLSPQIDLKIYATNNEVVYNVIYPYPENEEPIKPGEIREIKGITLSTTDLEDGRYRVEMSFLHKGESVFVKDFKFNVGNPDGKVLGAFNMNYTIFWPILVAIAVVAVIAVFFTLKQRKKKA